MSATDNEQIEEFMAELYDKFYPQVMQGLGRMQEGDVHGGIDELARPLHTIKGVTGFIGGFEEASTFTHKVESFLKKVQGEEIAQSSDVSSTAITAVNLIFQVIEQIRETGSGPQQEMEDILAHIQTLSDSGETAGPKTGTVEIRLEETDIIARVTLPRIHLPEQCKALEEVLEKQSEGVPLLFDMSEVITVGSGAWETLLAYVDRVPIRLTGMNPAIQGTLHSWGFDKAFKVYASVDAYLDRNTCRQEDKA